LAKLYGGLIIDYSQIKQGKMHYEQNGNDILLDVPGVEYIEEYKTMLLRYAQRAGFNSKKIEQLVPVIFLNMAPLHAAPFDKILWYLGLKLLHENIL
jgi:hypothetical protein